MKQNLIFIFLLVLSISCTKESSDEYKDVLIHFEVPSNFPSLEYNVNSNPLTEKGVELGKKIFYDGRLSSDGIVSCGFCHVQEDAFTHHGHTFSHGVGDHIGTRNTPPIQNLAFQKAFMWDGVASHLDLQPIIPLTSEIEMNGNFSDIITMMNSDDEYRKLFKVAFKTETINSEYILKALSQFMVFLTSSNSKFDKFRRGEVGGEFTDEEVDGYAIFNQKCAVCHVGDLMTDDSFRNNGLSINPQINDFGRYRVTQLEEDKFKFKVPSLRNIEKTAPYMHDGRFFSLDAVLNHYVNGVVATENLDSNLTNNGVLGIPLTADEKTKIIAFLKTLTDYQFLSDRRFSEF